MSKLQAKTSEVFYTKETVDALKAENAALRNALECVTGVAGRRDELVIPTIGQWEAIVREARAALNRSI